ncbi:MULTISPECIES: hypothetical protein [Pseudomonas]|jgi:hypothetical protein|uniref:hypothetical protein n=1 Tax=Pseudomonas TaxID=286 RepID=UPI00076130B6|nr:MULTISPECIES: hypothetical protein [Pseudomonas]MCE0903640.1 hypothetical protein [Pseudomonas alloputida]
MKKYFFGLVAGSLLSGCATQKPPLSDGQYTAFATQLITIMKCVNSGYMSPDVGARGQQYSMANLNTWQFDQNYFMSRAQQIGNSVNPSQGDCNMLSMNIVQTKNQIDAQNQQAAQEAQAWQNLRNQQEQNKTTYCNQIGTQTICNRY